MLIIRNIDRILILGVLIAWSWAGFLWYECNSLASSIRNTEKDCKSVHEYDGHFDLQRSSAERIRKLQEKLHASEKQAQAKKDEWLKRKAASLHIHRWDEMPSRYITLDEARQLAPEMYEDILNSLNKKKEKYTMRLAERDAFLKAIKDEWLTEAERRQWQTYLANLEILDNDDINCVLNRDERNKLVSQTEPYEHIQEILEKCCRRIVGSNELHSEDVDEIRRVFKVPMYEFVLPMKP